MPPAESPVRKSDTSAALSEAERLMVVCNSCRYCEGMCAVFPAMELRRTFSSGDLNYLANLCHNCGACYDACQFAPPHEFAVNVPRTLAVVRNNSYQQFAWPRSLSGLFARNGVACALILAICIALLLVGTMLAVDADVFLGQHTGPGAFYRIIPHNLMIGLFGIVFLYAIVALAMGARTFWNSLEEPAATLVQTESVLQAIQDTARLRYLDGGSGSCDTEGEPDTDRRKLFHHFTAYGFLLCFLATVVATLYHYVLRLEAPYAWYQLPVVLGTLGGLGLIIGPIGLLRSRSCRPAILEDSTRHDMGAAFLVLLLVTSVTGLALLILRESSWMGVLLAIHLGAVLALFAVLPYGKFVHGLYRFLALVRYAHERRSRVPISEN
jgi:citrate/tricarballylate utilization protein